MTSMIVPITYDLGHVHLVVIAHVGKCCTHECPHHKNRGVIWMYHQGQGSKFATCYQHTSSRLGIFFLLIVRKASLSPICVRLVRIWNLMLVKMEYKLLKIFIPYKLTTIVITKYFGWHSIAVSFNFFPSFKTHSHGFKLIVYSRLR